MFKSAWMGSIAVVAAAGTLYAAEGAKLVTPRGLQTWATPAALATAQPLRPAKIAEAAADPGAPAPQTFRGVERPAAARPPAVATREAAIVDPPEKPAELSSRRTAAAIKSGRIAFRPSVASTPALGSSQHSNNHNRGPSLVDAYLAAKEQSPQRAGPSILPVEPTMRRTQRVVERAIASPQAAEAREDTANSEPQEEVVGPAVETDVEAASESEADDGENYAPIVSAADLPRPGSVPNAEESVPQPIPPVKLNPTSPQRTNRASPAPATESSEDADQPDRAQRSAAKPAKQISTLMGKLRLPDFRSRPQPKSDKPK